MDRPSRSYGFRLEEAWIPMPDGVRLAANLFLPDGADAAERFPAVLEYLPYRKDDGLFERDWDLYSYLVPRGFVGAKVDIRGTGRSEGVLPDREYSEQEQADGEVVIAWLAEQAWSNGNVGMWGISWGGFNSIQMAMREPPPPALRAILAVDATDDLFHDDVHYIDGMMHVDEYDVMIDLDGARSGAPGFPMDEETLAARFDRPPWKLLWLRHQRDGDFWRRGSLRPDHARLRVPAFLIGGYLDGYRDSVPRMLHHVPGPVKAIVGPWNHTFPHAASPGPEIEWRHEAVRWWSWWLRGEDTGIMAEPPFAVFVRRWHPPGTALGQVPGEWRWEDGWPLERGRDETLTLRDDHSLGPEAGPASSHRSAYVPSAGAETGLVWWGELVPDQGAADRACLVYDSAPLEDDVEILGFPRAALRASANAPLAHWFVRLSDVAPDGAVTLVTGAGLNGAHRRSAADPEPLRPGATEDLTVEMHFASWVFPRGHRIRLAVSNAQWPMIWPSPFAMTTSLSVGEGGSRLSLPVVPFEERPRPTFLPAVPPTEPPGWSSGGEILPGRLVLEREGGVARARWSGAGWSEAPWGRSEYDERLWWEVADDRPASAAAGGSSVTTVNLPDRTIAWRGTLEVRSDGDAFHYSYRRQLEVDGALIRERRWQESVPRDHQ